MSQTPLRSEGAPPAPVEPPEPELVAPTLPLEELEPGPAPPADDCVDPLPPHAAVSAANDKHQTARRAKEVMREKVLNRAREGQCRLGDAASPALRGKGPSAPSRSLPWVCTVQGAVQTGSSTSQRPVTLPQKYGAMQMSFCSNELANEQSPPGGTRGAQVPRSISLGGIVTLQ